MPDILTQLWGDDIGLGHSRELILRNPVIRSRGGAAIQFPDGLTQTGVAITPEAAGFTVDRTGTTSSAAQLNLYFLWLFANRAKGRLGPGTFKTDRELLITGDIDDWMGLDFDGAIIQPAVGHDYHGLRVAITGNSDGHTRPAPIRDAKVHGQYSGSLPTDGKAAIILDATPLMPLYNPEALGFDIGFDFINNCYNSVLYSPSVPRFDSCNCGINLRAGSDSGSDLNFYDVQVYAALTAINIEGNGGGYHFYGGQLLAQSTFVGTQDGLGVITLCKVYKADGSGATVSGAYSILFQGVSWEGWRGMWAFRSYGDFTVSLIGCSFNPSASTAGQQAIGMWKGTSVSANSQIHALGNRIAGSCYFANAAGATCSFASAAPSTDEGLWSSDNTTCNGVTQSPGWFQAIGRDVSGYLPTYEFGFARYINNSTGRYEMAVGHATWGSLYYGFPEQSPDGGTTYWPNLIDDADGRTLVGYSDQGKVFGNTGATAIAPFVLPAANLGSGAVLGFSVSFIVMDADGIRVTAAGTDTINVAGSVSAGGGKIEATTIGAAITLTCVASGKWIATACSDKALWTVT